MNDNLSAPSGGFVSVNEAKGQGAAWEQALAPEMQTRFAELAAFIPTSARPGRLPGGVPSAAPPPDPQALRAAVEGLAGLVSARVAARPFPLWLRAGTNDVEAAIAALDPGLRGLKPVHEPRRILEIGAGAGYRSVAMAQAWPGAEILATEPDAACQRVALLNTLAYGNITSLCLTLSTDAARYAWFGRTGEAGRLCLMREESGNIAATPLRNLLFSKHWNDVDTIVITPDAASDHILRTSLPASVRLIAVQTGGAPLHEGTAPFYPDEQFLSVVSGDYVLLYRRGTEAVASVPRSVPVFNLDAPAQALRLENVAETGFFPLTNGGFRLHPNGWGAPPARARFSLQDRDYAELHLSMRVMLAMSAPVKFTVELLAEGGVSLFSHSEVVSGGKAVGVVLELPAHRGPCEVLFTTEMAEYGASCAGAWAEIVSATLV